MLKARPFDVSIMGNPADAWPGHKYANYEMGTRTDLLSYQTSAFMVNRLWFPATRRRLNWTGALVQGRVCSALAVLADRLTRFGGSGWMKITKGARILHDR